MTIISNKLYSELAYKEIKLMVVVVQFLEPEIYSNRQAKNNVLGNGVRVFTALLFEYGSL
jgi:hypothetical protein